MLQNYKFINRKQNKQLVKPTNNYFLYLPPLKKYNKKA